jgi:hypothetical protein
MLLGVAGGIALFVIRYVRAPRRRAQMRVPLTEPQAASGDDRHV